MKSLIVPVALGVVVAGSTIAINIATSCSPALADSGNDLLDNKSPPPGLNFGGRSTQGMAPDDGTDVLRPTATPDLNFGGRSTKGMAADDGTDVLRPTVTPDLNFGGRSTKGMAPDDGTDVLRPTVTPDLNFGGRSTGSGAPSVANRGAPLGNSQTSKKCVPKTRLTGSLVAASEVLTASDCKP